MVSPTNSTVQTVLAGEAMLGRRVFITGHTGFKGSWLSIWLHRMGAKVFGYSLGTPGRPSNFEASNVQELLVQHFDADIRSREKLTTAIEAADPDVIFHLAAQPLVRESYQTPYETFDVNFMGTCNLLEALRLRGKPCVVVVVTSDKCYENLESVRCYREDDAMGGHDPYSASKGAAELLVASYRRSFFDPARIEEHGIKVATARAGNVIGGGDWARDRIVPDIVSHLLAGKPVSIRNPRSVRPWQHVLEPLGGYIALASQMLLDDATCCDGWNFGPSEEGTACVGDLVDRFCAAWGHGSWQYTGESNQPHEAQLLQLSIKKAARHLDWRPVWTLQYAVEHTALWYRDFYSSPSGSMVEVCLGDIDDYTRAAGKSARHFDQTSKVAA